MVKQKQSGTLAAIHQLLSYLAVASLFFLAIGLKDLDNYIDWLRFTVIMLSCGSISGLMIYLLCGALMPDFRRFKSSAGLGFPAPLLFVSAMVFFGCGAMVNESEDLNRACAAHVIQDMGSGGFRHRSYYVYIDDGTEKERLDFGIAFYEKHQVGDTIDLCVVTGRLGFRYYEVNRIRDSATTAGGH